MIKVLKQARSASAGSAAAIGAAAMIVAAAARESGQHEILERMEKMTNAILPAGASTDGAFVDDLVSTAAADLPLIASELEARLQVAAAAKD